MLTSVARWWDSQPHFIRDFAEGCAAAAVAGAAAGVLALNLDAATPKEVVGVALFGAISAVIAFARHRLAPTPNKPA